MFITNAESLPSNIENRIIVLKTNNNNITEADDDDFEDRDKLILTHRKVVEKIGEHDHYHDHDHDQDATVVPIITEQSREPTHEVINEENISSNKNQFNNILKPKLILIIQNFSVVHNLDYELFRSKNNEKWGNIQYLLDLLIKLLRKLNINLVEVSADKLENLANDEFKKISNFELIQCLTDRELINKELDKPNKLFGNLKESAIVRIQKFCRLFIIRKKFKKLKIYLKKVSKIQRVYRLHQLIKNSQMLLREKFEIEIKIWEKMMEDFKQNWKFIKDAPRVEIHINSLSYSSYKNCTIDKFKQQQNNQLSRIMSLKDPNVEIIYIAPFEIDKDALSYYFSIMKTLGIEKVKERFHVLIPVK